jgi:hypothetical protein
MVIEEPLKPFWADERVDEIGKQYNCDGARDHIIESHRSSQIYAGCDVCKRNSEETGPNKKHRQIIHINAPGKLLNSGCLDRERLKGRQDHSKLGRAGYKNNQKPEWLL